MAARRSIATEATMEVLQELASLRPGKGFKPMPGFMQEEVPAREEATRVKNMGVAERKEYLQQVGLDHMLQVAQRLAKH